MKAVEIHEHFKSVGTWVDWEHSCDAFKAGDPETEVRRVAVAWQATLPALRDAVAGGADLFITHEPTFYVHMDDDPRVFEHAFAREKKRFIEQSGLVIYRCHDVWDRMPEIGILDSWARQLGFDGPPAASATFHAAYPFRGTLGDLAQRVRQCTEPLGQQRVWILGEPDVPVSRVALGTGAITDFGTMLSLGADAMVVTDDGIAFWSAGCQATDSGIPLVVVNHATAEEPGMRNLARYLQSVFPALEVRHIPMGCLYSAV